MDSVVTVSVCIPTYNYGHFIVDAIESVISQSYPAVEIVVVDNCSTDNTREIVANMMAEDRRITYFCNETNVGPRENLNRCLQHATGEYIKILCADDLLEPGCLEKMVAVLAANPRVSLVASGRHLVDGTLKRINQESYSAKYTIWPGYDAINRCLFNGNYIGEPTAVLFRKKQASRGFNTEYSQLIDLEMWFHLLEQGDFAAIPEGLCKIRQHDAQQTKSNRQAFAFLPDENRLFAEFSQKSYVRQSSILRLSWRLRMAHYIWRDRHHGGENAGVLSLIGKYIHPLLFILLYPVAAGLKKIIKLAKY